MKGVKIKFRAKDDRGKFVHGGYCHIDKDSLAQLVGYDVNHNEIYEDDELVDDDGNTYRVCLTAMFINDKNGFIGFNLSPATVKLHGLTLKVDSTL